MAKGKGMMIVAGLGAVGFFLYNKAVAAQKLIVEGASIQNLSLKNGAITFDTILLITNPTNQNISIRGIGGNIQINREVIGSAITDMPVLIERFATSSIVVPTRIGFLSTIYISQQIYNAVKGAGIEVSFSGAARAFGFNVPIDTTMKLKI